LQHLVENGDGVIEVLPLQRHIALLIKIAEVPGNFANVLFWHAQKLSPFEQKIHCKERTRMTVKTTGTKARQQKQA
jgi:hypothetical protein